MQDGLKALPHPCEFNPNDIEDADLRNRLSLIPRDPNYLDALEEDLVNRVSQLVATLRASNQRRDAMRQAIIEKNRERVADEQIPLLQFMRQCITRWNSTFYMVDRWLHLTPVSTISAI